MSDIINTFIEKKTNQLLNKLDKKLNNKFYTASKTSLDEFRAVIANAGGLQRLNRFIFNIPVPDFLRETLIEKFTMQNILATQGLNIFDGSLGLLCQKITVPPKSLRTTQIKINGQTRTVPSNYTWDTVTAEFIDPLNGLIYETFYNWMDGINNPITNTGRFYDEYVKDLRLDFLSRNSEVVGYISLNEAFPISVSKASLSYDAEGYMTTSVTFSYLYQTNRDYSSNMLYNILNNVTGGAAGELLNVATSVVDKYVPNPSSVEKSLKNLVKF